MDRPPQSPSKRGFFPSSAEWADRGYRDRATFARARTRATADELRRVSELSHSTAASTAAYPIADNRTAMGPLLEAPFSIEVAERASRLGMARPVHRHQDSDRHALSVVVENDSVTPVRVEVMRSAARDRPIMERRRNRPRHIATISNPERSSTTDRKPSRSRDDRSLHPSYSSRGDGRPRLRVIGQVSAPLRGRTVRARSDKRTPARRGRVQERKNEAR